MDSNTSLASPSSNTGAQSAVIDWLSFTYPIETTLEQVQSHIGKEGFISLPKGGFGYKQALACGHVTIFHDGAANMGIHVVMSGQGCREFEASPHFRNWAEFLRVIIDWGCKVARLDVAIDDRAGLLDKDRIEQAIVEGRVVSRYEHVRDIGRRSLRDGSASAWTRYFGSGMSETSIRIYDKAQEQGLSEAFHWMRCELQMRNKRAHVMAEFIATKESLYGLGGFFLGLIDFKEAGTSAQRTRWATCGWWSAFLEAVDKLRLTTAPLVRTIHQVAAWVERQVAPSLALLVEASEGSIDFLTDWIVKGRERWTIRHRNLLAVNSLT